MVQDELFGVGSYTIQEAARLIGTHPRNISRWMRGYSYTRNMIKNQVEPLWKSEWPTDDGHVELGFRDLIELRFVKAFIDEGVGLLAIRNCLEFARSCVDDDHPFSTRRFQTDGKTIFLESIRSQDNPKLLDLKKRQYVFRQIVERTFKDLDLEDDVVARWRPYRGKDSIVIDPRRSFGQPIAAKFGVPTVVLADAVKAEGSAERVARLFDVTPAVVNDAVRFEKNLTPA